MNSNVKQYLISEEEFGMFATLMYRMQPKNSHHQTQGTYDSQPQLNYIV